MEYDRRKDTVFSCYKARRHVAASYKVLRVSAKESLETCNDIKKRKKVDEIHLCLGHDAS
jgi:hypothetical protein